MFNLMNASSTEMVFWATAIFGTVFFFLRIILMIFGVVGGDSSDGVVDTDSGNMQDMTHHLDSTDAAFKLLTMNTITGFFMMFGWMGLAAYKQFQLGVFLSFVIAVFAGVFTMFLTALIFKLAMSLNSSGTVFNVQKTIGLKGSVYLRIPAEGCGQIQIIVDNQTRILDAISEDKIEIDSFQEIIIVRAVDLKTVAVRKKD